MSLKIKDYGRDREFNSVDELKSSLSEQYKGRHVSIVYHTSTTRLLRTIFVSVDDAGGINETYNQSLVDFNAIKDDLSGQTL